MFCAQEVFCSVSVYRKVDQKCCTISFASLPEHFAIVEENSTSSNAAMVTVFDQNVSWKQEEAVMEYHFVKM